MKKSPQNRSKLLQEQVHQFPNHTLKKSPRIEVTRRRMSVEENQAFEHARNLLLADIVQRVMEIKMKEADVKK